jgi:hypothetical protein
MQIEIITNQIVNLCSAIDNIKGGRVERAVELLERGLDGCVFGLGRIKEKGGVPDQTERDILIEALKIARVHRSRYPRQAKPGNHIQKAVQKILENIES